LELQDIDRFEQAAIEGRRQPARFGLALLFIVGVMGYAGFGPAGGVSPIVVVAAMLGGYMALNIGANDVANNVGPAVGAKAIKLGTALVIAAVFEAAGALIAGAEVVRTIRHDILDRELFTSPDTFVWLMLAALLAGALWLNIANAVGAPVSTTHAIIGAVAGAGMAAAGPAAVNWTTIASVTASWVISPLMGGAIAAVFLYLIKRSITYRVDMASAARRVVPLLVGAMAWSFVTYLILTGLDRLWRIGFLAAAGLGAVAGVLTSLFVRSRLAAMTLIPNTKKGVNRLFATPLVFAAALLSFAHGSNDVANAVGPLAAIVDVVGEGRLPTAAPTISRWVMLVGALGIAVGLLLFGPRVIRTVGVEITALDQMRAYCVVMAATLTVIVASQLGLPVSTTHVAVGGVLGVGFLREYLKSHYARMIDEIKAHHPSGEQAAIDDFTARFDEASVERKAEMLRELKVRSKKGEDPANFSPDERKKLRGHYRQELVKRSLLMRILAAWLITVPASALMAALLYFTIRGMMLP
jgi:PiT family inorganic phosphate transporter